MPTKTLPAGGIFVAISILFSQAGKLKHPVDGQGFWR